MYDLLIQFLVPVMETTNEEHGQLSWASFSPVDPNIIAAGSNNGPVLTSVKTHSGILL